MTRKSAARQAHFGRRAMLQTAGAAIGSGAITGFPTIWAQNIKDIVLQHAGPPVAAIPAIGEQASKDLGFTVHMQASENADLLNRFLTQSSAMDCADVSLTYLRYLVGRDILQTIPVAKAANWDKTIPLFTKGEYPDGRKASRQATLPILLPGILGVAMGALTLSYDEYARTTLTIGPLSTLPLEIYALISSATSPTLLAIGTLTTSASFLIIATTLVLVFRMQRRRFLARMKAK